MKNNFIYNLLLTGSNLLFPLLTFPYLSRVFGAEGLGICNFISSYSQNYIIIAALGMPVYATREISKIGTNKLKRSHLFFELLTFHLLFTLFLLIIYSISIFTFEDLYKYKEIALLSGSLIFFNVFSIEWLFSGVNDFKYITIRSLIVRTFSVFFIFLLVKRKNDYTIYFTIIAITAFINILVDIYYARKIVTRKVILSFNGILSHFRGIFILGIYMVLISIYSVLPTTLLGFLSTKTSVGYYYGANKIIRMILTFFTALITVLTPKLNWILEEKGEKEYLLLIDKSLDIVISFGVPISFFVFLLANPIVMLLAGKNFFNSILIVQIMSPIILIVAFAQIFVLLILSIHRKDKNMALLSVFGMIASLVINIIFIPKYAEKATAISQLIAESIVTIASYILAKNILSFNLPLKKLILNILLVIPFSLITHVTFQITNNYLFIIISSAVLCSIYFLFYQITLIKSSIIINLTRSLNIPIK